jgi:hypothetical protein
MAIAEEIVESLRARFEAVLPHLDERPPSVSPGFSGHKI